MHNGEEVIYIEYIDKIPHSVITDKNRLMNYDFECIGNDRKDIQWYNYGSGGERNKLQAPKFVRGKFKANYWMAEGYKFKGRSKAENCERIEKPFKLKSYSRSSINPFKVSWENSYGFDYCKICDAHYCHDTGCHDHHTWSDEHCSFVYEDGTLAD